MNIEFDFNFRNNGIIKRKWSRIKVKAYRGVPVNGRGTGMAIYTQGLYSATKRSVAAQYGRVHVVSYEDLPWNPLSVRDSTWYDYLVYNVIKPQFERIRSEAFNVNYVKPILQDMGYDGLVIGPMSDAIIVKW